MTVYVDDMYTTRLGQFGRMKMSHMIADSDAELHAMAALIGVDKRWFQKPGTPSRHYDIALSKRELALAAGAIAITMKQAAAMCAHRRLTGELCSPDAAKTWRINP